MPCDVIDNVGWECVGIRDFKGCTYYLHLETAYMTVNVPHSFTIESFINISHDEPDKVIQSMHLRAEPS